MKTLAIIAVVLAGGYFWMRNSQAAGATSAGPSGGCPPSGPLTPQQATQCPNDPRVTFAGSGVSVYSPAPSPTQREAPQYSATFSEPVYAPAFMDESIAPGAVEA